MISSREQSNFSKLHFGNSCFESVLVANIMKGTEILVSICFRPFLCQKQTIFPLFSEYLQNVEIVLAVCDCRVIFCSRTFRLEYCKVCHMCGVI
jgi:hypothetical protein